MKLHIYGGSLPRERNLRILGGGYNVALGRAVLIVQDDDGCPGTITFDVSEARETANTLTKELPQVERVAAAPTETGKTPLAIQRSS